MTEVKDLATDWFSMEVSNTINQEMMIDLKMREPKLIAKSRDQRACSKLQANYLIVFILNNHCFKIYPTEIIKNDCKGAKYQRVFDT